nr:class I SAM-dependent methyltransferase [Brachybacterium squillarum]
MTPTGSLGMPPLPGGGAEENRWTAAVRRDPSHSQRYAERWRRLEASGQDIHGEARLIDAMAARGSRILDAGCGSGRVAAYLARAGHDVLGVDLDPHLIETARTEQPSARFEQGDLARLDLRDAAGERPEFDLIVSAGNVLTFLATAERLPALHGLAAHLAPEGRLVVGFGLDRGYGAEDFLADAAAAGLTLQARFSSWDLRPADDGFLVAVLGHAEAPAAAS